jgi:hypothetical protein
MVAPLAKGLSKALNYLPTVRSVYGPMRDWGK